MIHLMLSIRLITFIPVNFNNWFLASSNAYFSQATNIKLFSYSIQALSNRESTSLTVLTICLVFRRSQGLARPDRRGRPKHPRDREGPQATGGREGRTPGRSGGGWGRPGTGREQGSAITVGTVPGQTGDRQEDPREGGGIREHKVTWFYLGILIVKTISVQKTWVRCHWEQ